MCVVHLYSEWLRRGRGAGCRSWPAFPKPFSQSLGLSKQGASCKQGCTRCPALWRLSAAVQIAWDEGTTWQRRIRVLEGLWLGEAKSKGAMPCVCVCATLLYPQPRPCPSSTAHTAWAGGSVGPGLEGGGGLGAAECDQEKVFL